MAKRWKKEEITYLRRYAKTKHVSELAERFKTDSATVQLQLKELELEALDSVDPSPLEGSRQLALFERALKSLHSGRWKQAIDGFEKVISEGDQPDLINRARRYQTVAREQAKGGPADVEAEDPYLQAVFERNNGNFDEALRIATVGGRRAKDPRFAYLVASIHVAREELDSAAEYLAMAIELDPMSRVHALNDADFEPLRASSDHSDLFKD